MRYRRSSATSFYMIALNELLMPAKSIKIHPDGIGEVLLHKKFSFMRDGFEEKILPALQGKNISEIHSATKGNSFVQQGC